MLVTSVLVVQAWKDWGAAGTTIPRVIAEKRSAFIVDRSAVNGTTNNLNVIQVDTN